MVLIHTVSVWLATLGYGAVFLVLLAESLGIPAPSEIILLLSGYLVWEGRFSFPAVVLWGAAGSTLGAVAAYQLALRGGRPLLETRLRFLFRRSGSLAHWEAYFLRRGALVVLIGRVISGVRMVISYPAGLFRMPFARFVGYTFAGSLAWPVLAAGAGWLLGPHVQAGVAAIDRYKFWAALAVLAGLAGWWWWRRRLPQSPRRPEDCPP